MSHEERAALIDKNHDALSIVRQTELLNISRSSVYYEPVVNGEDIRIMHAIDAIFTAYPFYGSRRIQAELEDQRVCICREHVQHLMRAMGLEAIYPKKRVNISLSNTSHKKYPYLLRTVGITRPNHVWGVDITYIRLQNEFAYLVAIIDWFSRYVLAFELSASLETKFCMTALNRALHTATPEIHNSDQGTQFTDERYTAILRSQDIQISMDGRGRCMDNIFTERLWRSVKYEDVYLKSYQTIHEAREGLSHYFTFYNTTRKHQSLNYRTPAQVYFNNE